MGGLWGTAPRLGAAMLLFALASLGLPGLGNFVGEFLILAGSFRVSVAAAVTAALGFIIAAVYALWMVQRVLLGPNTSDWKLIDLSGREMVLSGALAVVLLWVGLFPQPMLDAVSPAIAALQEQTVTPGRIVVYTPPPALKTLSRLKRGRP